MSNSIPSSKAPIIDETGNVTPAWYRFLAGSVPPQGATVLWPGGTAFPAGYVSIGTIPVDGWAHPLHILAKGTGART